MLEQVNAVSTKLSELYGHSKKVFLKSITTSASTVTEWANTTPAASQEALSGFRGLL